MDRFAELPRRSGVDVTLHVAEGVAHVCRLLAVADASIADARKWLRAKLGGVRRR